MTQNIQFDADQALPVRTPLRKKSLTQFFMEKSFGLLKTEGQATVFMLLLSIFSLVVAVFFLSESFSKKPAEKIEGFGNSAPGQYSRP